MGRRGSTLHEAISLVLSENKMTYREITHAINRLGLFRPRDGLFVPVAQVRVCVQEHPIFFSVDRATSPNLIEVRRLV